MNIKILSLLFTAFLFLSFSSVAQAKWEKLGSRVVNYGLDRDVIHVGAQRGGFTKLKVAVSGGAINMHKMIVEYQNGTKESIDLRFNFSKKSASRVIDIRGGKRLIRDITFVYDTKNLSRTKAKVHVLGRR